MIPVWTHSGNGQPGNAGSADAYIPRGFTDRPELPSRPEGSCQFRPDALYLFRAMRFSDPGNHSST